MQPGREVWQFLRDFANGLVAQARRLTVWSNNIDVIDVQPNRLVLNANNRRIVADRRTRNFMAADRVIASFDTVESIEIRYVENGDGPEYWTVSLATTAHKRVAIGKTFDDAQASVAAARLATIASKKVVAVR
jgi:hypothetical protein